LLAALAALALQQANGDVAAANPTAKASNRSSPTSAARLVIWPTATTVSGSRPVHRAATVPSVPATTAVRPPKAPPAAARPPAAATLHALAATPGSVAPPPSQFGCGAALAYLAAHAAPGFRFECPGYSLGHQAMTCINVAGVCSDEKLIVITIPCRAAYMNEASNSWSMQGLSSAPIDPYGYCH
jgi:hypothetical protein